MTPRSILLVEDEPVVAFDVAHRLQLLGYPAPSTVPSGEEALRAAAAMRPDIVLMDIMLEGEMDGIETAALLHDRFDVPVIYLTGLMEPSLLERAKITGPFGYVVKPFDDRELHICIEMALYKHAAERERTEREQLFAATLRSIREAVMIIDRQGVITFCNPAAQELLHLSATQLEQRMFASVASLMVEGDATASDPRRLVLRHAGTGRRSLNAILQHASGHCPVEISATVTGDSPDRAGTVLVLRDMTTRRRDKASLTKALDELQRVFEQTVMALAVTSEKRDPYTAGHQQRVARLACAIAARTGMDVHRCQGIRMAGLLHDIGKIYVPSEILTKPATLSAIEQNIMRTHPRVGFDILKGVDFPWPVAQTVLQHHERLDGSGYPLGLCKDDILPESRVLAVADVVEAMFSHRPYRPSLGLTHALDEIRTGAGTLYCADAVRACLELFDEGFAFDTPAEHPADNDGDLTP
jgi:putative nucleotidyltransferase with HDIG domain/PAS domain S-box-containing protein